MDKPLTLAQLSGDEGAAPIPDGKAEGTQRNEGKGDEGKGDEGIGNSPEFNLEELQLRDPESLSEEEKTFIEDSKKENKKEEKQEPSNADKEKANRIAELQAISDEDITPEQVQELRDLGVDVLEHDGEFWEDVEKLTGDKVEVDFGNTDPESPEGVLKYMDAYSDAKVSGFEEHLKKVAPRAYQAMLVEVDGGNPAEYFLPKGDADTTDYSTIEITDDNTDVHKQVLRKAFSLRGIDEDIAELTINALEDKGQLKSTAEKDLKYVVDTTETQRQAELNRVTESKQQEEKLLSDMASFVDSSLEKGTVGSFTIPKADVKKFNDFVKQSIQVKDGQFFSVSNVTRDNFDDILQNLFFAYKGGNIDNLAKTKANKENVRRLRKRVSDNKITSQGGKTTPKVTRLGDI